jgi:hypothetical protein
MAAYYKVDVSLNTNAVEVGLPSPQTVNVTIPLVGPAGPQGPAGEGGGGDLTSPGPIGSVAPNTGAFTTLSATGTATLPHIHGSLAGNLYIHVKNTSGGQLTRGTPVYIVGNVGSTDRVEVAAADFDDATKMPAVGLLEQTLANNGSGDAIILGELDEANTNAYTINTELFVGNNGALTSTRPTTGQVQSVGTVARVNSNSGVIVVNMQGRRSPNEAFALSPAETYYNITATSIGSPQQIDLSASPFTEATEVRSVLNNSTGIVYVQILLPIDAVSIVPKFRFYGQISGAGDILNIQLIRDSVVVFPASGSGYEELNDGETLEVVWNGTAYGLTPNAPFMRRITLPDASGTLALTTLLGTPAELVIACSDETSNLTTGTAKVTFRMPYAMTLSSVRASVNTAPTGSTLIVDINEGGSTILSTKLSIDASELTSTTAASAAVISDTGLADDAEITIDIDQIGSTIAGKGLKVVLKGTRA